MGRTPVTAIFLQARLNSRRLPRKALLPLAGHSVIEHVMRALGSVAVDLYGLLTDRASAAELAPLAEVCRFRLFAGSAEDVLGRYCAAARHWGVDVVVRATGDNPLVSPRMTSAAIERQRLLGCDYFAFDSLPLGSAVEVVRADALARAAEQADSQYEREHVTPRILHDSAAYRVVRAPAPLRASGRVTLDDSEDYTRLQKIFAALYRGAPIEIDRLIDWLENSEQTGRQIDPDQSVGCA